MKHNLIFPLVSVLGLAAVVALMFLYGTHDAVANEPNVAPITATSSTMSVGPQEVKTLFSDAAVGSMNGLCASRVVSTLGGSAIMLSFDPDITPAAGVGHVQAASTTVAYPADTYGCGAVQAYGFASSTVTRTETRW